MNLELTDKRVLVTGGASNIGRAISLAFGKEGAVTIVADNDVAQAERTVDEIVSRGGVAHPIILDVTDLEAVKIQVARIEAEIWPIDILVNNVGWNGHQEFFLNLGPERWENPSGLISFRISV